MPDSGGPMKAFKKRMSFSQKLPKVFRSKDKEAKDDPHKSTISEASATSEASNASTNQSAADSTATGSVAASIPPTKEKYCTLRLSEDMAISIGDSFEPNPKCELDDASYFDYGPIRWPKFLRLLLVFPAINAGEPLESLIFHADLHEVPFQMLKYDQGDDVHPLHVNGMKKLVSKGLYDALYAIRERARGRAYSVLWVDEVCVNQEDPREVDAHVRLKRDITAACTGKTAVDSAFNANFKQRGRSGRRSERGESSRKHSRQQDSGPSGGRLTRHTSNASDMSGSTEIALSSRWQSRAQSVASIRTTERIGPDSDSEHGSHSSTDDTDASDEENDRVTAEEKKKWKGKAPAISPPPPHVASRSRGGSSAADAKPPRISISFETPKPPRAEPESDDAGKGVDGESDDKSYHVMKSQPLSKGVEA